MQAASAQSFVRILLRGQMIPDTFDELPKIVVCCMIFEIREQFF